MATHGLIAALCVSHALRPAARTTRRAPRMVLDVASASHVIAAATPVALDYGALATKAIGGGASGALAGVVQVSSLMWLRTAMTTSMPMEATAR